MTEQPTLYDALETCRTPAEVRNFLVDLLSEKELTRAEARWAIAWVCLKTGCSKNVAEKDFRASQDLVSRVFEAALREGSGYGLAYARLEESARANPDVRG